MSARTERCKCGTDALGGCRIHNRSSFERAVADARDDERRKVIAELTDCMESGRRLYAGDKDGYARGFQQAQGEVRRRMASLLAPEAGAAVNSAAEDLTSASSGSTGLDAQDPRELSDLDLTQAWLRAGGAPVDGDPPLGQPVTTAMLRFFASALPSGGGRSWTMTGKPSGDGIFPDVVQVEGPTLRDGERVVVCEAAAPSGGGERAGRDGRSIVVRFGADDSLPRLVAGEPSSRTQLVRNEDGTYTLQLTQRLAEMRAAGRKPAAEFFVEGFNRFIEEIEGVQLPAEAEAALDRFRERWNAYNGGGTVTPADAFARPPASSEEEPESRRGSLGSHVARKSAEVDSWPEHAQPAYARASSEGEQDGRSEAARMLAEFEGHPHSRPTSLSLELTLHREEHAELQRELELGEDALDRARLARELADVTYLAYRSAHVHGIDLDAALREIHRAAMDKIAANVRRSDGKILKPPGFVPPDMSSALVPAPSSSTEGGEDGD